MKRIAIALLLLTPMTAYSQDWFEVGATVQGVNYIDSESIKDKASYVQAWGLEDYKKRNTSREMSSKTLVRVRCYDEEIAVMQTTTYSGAGGSGSVIGSDIERTPDYRAVSPGSIGEGIIEFVCDMNQAALDGARAAEEMRKQLGK